MYQAFGLLASPAFKAAAELGKGATVEQIAAHAVKAGTGLVGFRFLFEDVESFRFWLYRVRMPRNLGLGVSKDGFWVSLRCFGANSG